MEDAGKSDQNIQGGAEDLKAVAKSNRILIVDDEDDITTVLKRGLEAEGFEVDAYNDPLLALHNYKQNAYDLALIDISMPKMNGFELFRELRARDSKIKVCFITAFEVYYDEFKRVFPKLKVTCFVRKPVTISVLAKTIREEIESVEETIQVPASLGSTPAKF